MPWNSKGSRNGTFGDHIAAMRASFVDRSFVKDKRVPPSISVTSLSPQETGFPCWYKAGKGSGKARGWAEWIVPRGIDNTAGRILYLHGGGYEYMSPPQVRPTTAQLALRSGMAVLCIDYRKIPEHRHPAQLDDAKQALEWISSNGPLGPGKATAVFCAGDSAGGGLALGLALWMRDNPRVGVRINGIAVVSLMTDLTCSGESYVSRRWTENGGDECDPLFRGADPAADSMPQIYRLMGKPGQAGSVPLTDPYISPLHAALHDLPQTLIIVGDADVMLSDSVDFGKKANAAESNVQVKVFPRMWHCFHRFSEGCGTGVPLQQAIEALDKQSDFFKTSLGSTQAPGNNLHLDELRSELEAHFERDLIKGWEAHLRSCLGVARRPLQQAAKDARAASDHWHSGTKTSDALQRDYLKKVKILLYELERAGESDFDGLLREALTCLQMTMLPAMQAPLLSAEDAAALDRIWKHRFGGVGRYKGLAHQRDLRKATQLAENVRSCLRTLLAADVESRVISRSAYAVAVDELREEIAIAGEVDFDGLLRQAVRVLEGNAVCKPACQHLLPQASKQDESTRTFKPARRWRAKVTEASVH